MCVIYLAIDHVPDHPLVLIANRDEFYDRPTAAAAFWEDDPNIYGGRDLKGGGTWLGVTRDGRFAAVTNYRDPGAPTGARSRGELVADFLRSKSEAEEYLCQVAARSEEYSGFNLFVGEIGERHEVFYYSNRGGAVKKLPSGIYGLSNHLLDTPWPKVESGKTRFAELLEAGLPANEKLFELLADGSLAADGDLPSTGVPAEIEKALSAIFIRIPGYGTRSSSVLIFESSGVWRLDERVFV